MAPVFRVADVPVSGLEVRPVVGSCRLNPCIPFGVILQLQQASICWS